MLECAAAACAPWLSATFTSKLEKVQLEAARTITGFVRSIPVEAVLAEYLLPPILARFQTISLLIADEWANLPPADDHRKTLFSACRQRLKRLAQNSISLSESTRSQSPGYTSNSPLPGAAFHSSMGQASPNPNSHHTS